MRFRRKSDHASGREPETGEQPVEAVEPAEGPWDHDDVRDDGVERIDLGSLLLQGEPARDLRLQVDEATGTVQAVLLAGQDGAMDVRAFAASRHGDLWSEIRPQIVEDMRRRGGTVTEREGRFGPELLCAVQVATGPDQVGVQHSRIVGVNGSRWMLRATFIGRPAVEPESAGEWEGCLTRVVVRRGEQAAPPGEPLAITLPEQARRLDHPPQDPRSALAGDRSAEDAATPSS